MNQRESGILLHISSLPGKYGIGDFGQGAYEFIDFLKRSGQKNWQILPIGTTSFGDSPYQSFSAFAGNPYFIDLDEFIDKAYLSKKDFINRPLENMVNKVNYHLLYQNKISLLKIAYNNCKKDYKSTLIDYYNHNKSWLRDFALFMAIKEYHSDVSWQKWPLDFQNYNSNRVLNFEEKFQDEIYFWIFTQYFFERQWMSLKKYANKFGIKIIGDLANLCGG